jgi:hypothetical protein
MTPKIEIFDARSIDRFTASSAPVSRYVASLAAGGARHYVDNVDVEVKVLAVDGEVLPLLISDRVGHNADVCSPYAHYVEYTLEEVAKRHPHVPPQLFKALLWPLAAVLKTGRIDQVVFVNNWLLTTNPRLNLTSPQIRELTARLVETCPESAIVFRSINARTDAAVLLMLRQNRYRLVRSRRIYLLDPTNVDYLDHDNAQWDRRLLARSPYRVVRDHEALAAYTPRLAALYHDVYLHRHSRLNPHFNEHFFALTLRENTLTYRAIERDGRIDGFVAYFVDDRVMTGVLLGYDVGQPRKLGLYRLLFALLTAEAAEAGLLLNLGGGTGRFKLLRGAMAAEEFDAVYDAHLPPHRRFSWTLLLTAAHLWSQV